MTRGGGGGGLICRQVGSMCKKEIKKKILELTI